MPGPAAGTAKPGRNAAAMRPGPSGPAITAAAASATIRPARKACRSRAASPGRGWPTRRRPIRAIARATWVCHNARPSGSVVAGRSVSVVSGRCVSAFTRSSLRSAARWSGQARARTASSPVQPSAPALSASASTCSQAGSRRKPSSSATTPNSPSTPSTGQIASQARSKKMTIRARTRRLASLRCSCSVSSPRSVIVASSCQEIRMSGNPAPLRVPTGRDAIAGAG